MKIKNLFTAALALSTLAAFSTNGYAISTSDGSNSNVIVKFENSEAFRDIKNGTIGTRKSEAAVLKSIEKNFRKSAARYLDSRYTLEVEVENIDLAGDQSQMTSRFGEHRVLTSVYPPRIAFRYTVTDANEQVVASGRANLTDLNYQHNITMAFRNNELAPYVNELVSSWVSRDLKRAVQTK